LNIGYNTLITAKNYDLIILDVSGNAVLLKQLNNSQKIININIDVTGLKPGVYSANISNGVNSVSKTFIKE
jgi:Secretion system C-terminal sorting domain